MKKLLITLLVCLLVFPSLAFAVDTAMLEAMENVNVFLDDRTGTDTVIRPDGMPWFGSCSQDGSTAVCFLDLVEMPNRGMTAFRLTVSLETLSPIYADKATLTVGGKDYPIIPESAINEYDMTYYEDYFLVLSDELLDAVKAMYGKKGGAFIVTLDGEEVVRCSFEADKAVVQGMYEAFKAAGGEKQ